MDDHMFSLEEVVNAVGGEVYAPGKSDATAVHMNINGVSKDTRTIKDGDIYFAIRGERFDGHDFIADAVAKGAVCVLADRREKIPDGVVAVLVEDTVTAIGLLAKHYRFKIGFKTICVTGSVGKTSTREMVARVISSSMKCYSTKMNENNEIGMPMTILSAPKDTEVLVLELGMRLKGEISYLTKIACPDIAIITTVGYSHIERLGSRENIMDAKCEIIEGLSSGGMIIVDGDDKNLVRKVQSTVPFGILVASVSVSGHNAGLSVEAYAENIKFEKENGVIFDATVRRIERTVHCRNVELQLNGIHNVKNSLYALLCGAVLGIPREKAIEAVKEFAQPQGRGMVHFTDRFIVIDDAYNASPESMEAAFGNLSVIGRGKRRIAVLGGMLELGDYSAKLHHQIGRSCGGYGFDAVFVTGDNRKDFIDGFKSLDKNAEVIECTDTEDVKKKLTGYVQDGDVLLFKASHSFGFEKLAGEFVKLGNG